VEDQDNKSVESSHLRPGDPQVAAETDSVEAADVASAPATAPLSWASPTTAAGRDAPRPAAQPFGVPQYGVSLYPPPVPPTPSRRRFVPVAIAVVAVIVLLTIGVGGSLAFFRYGLGQSPASAGGIASTPGYGTGTPWAPPTDLPTDLPALPTDDTTIVLNAPDQIGTLRKQADQSAADKMRADMSSAGVEQPFAVVYADSAAKGRRVVVWGGTGALYGIGDAQVQLDEFFSTVGPHLGSHVTVDPATPADAGTTGGTAECAKVNGLGIIAALCAWRGKGAILALIFSGLTPDTAAQHLTAILPALVTTS
jgi:hypothetical protein